MLSKHIFIEINQNNYKTCILKATYCAVELSKNIIR